MRTLPPPWGRAGERVGIGSTRRGQKGERATPRYHKGPSLSLALFPMRKTRGFTLVEIAFVLVIVAMITVLFASVTSTLLASQRRQATMSHLAAVDAALVQFVVQNQRLPCPADGTIATGTAGAGVEVAPNANGCTTQTNGVVPWVALGLGEQDATDGWGRRITYRVWNNLSVVGAMNMSACDPAGTAAAGGAPAYLCANTCVPGSMNLCTSPTFFLAGAGNPKGFGIQNVAGTAVMTAPATGAAYVLISAGESGGGAYTSAGVLAPTLTTDGTEEKKNYANLALRTTYYVDDQISDIAGVTHFDDVVLRPSVLTVATRAGLGPRAH
jgi:prepilin-type N-terminal cleavage/methylation domain-containing protein